jgi:2-succinyl-5-enolpyruvyl-6-hydroxy-3-cyclohexene-1-carboxylate synthase
MPVRDLEWFARPRPDVRVLANRGANGIDGVVSTVLGAAAGRPGSPTAGLLGDLALLHDCGGLLSAARRHVDCVLVVVDNDGGGIFSFLPQSTAVDEEDFERLFTVPHGLDLADLARLHGLASSEVVLAHQLASATRAGFEAGGINMIVARTERRSNVVVHDEIHAAVAASVEAAGHRAA